MKFLKYMFLTFILIFMACSSTKTPITPMVEYDNHMFNSFEGYYTQCQLDSICVADTLEYDLNKWIFIPLRDTETKENVSQYMFIKSLGEHESIYRVQKIDKDLYKITKRITQ